MFLQTATQMLLPIGSCTGQRENSADKRNVGGANLLWDRDRCSTTGHIDISLATVIEVISQLKLGAVQGDRSISLRY